jgi:hypothetical protein
MLFWIVLGIIRFHKLWPKILYHRLLGRDGYCHFPRTMTRDSLCCFEPRRILPYSKDYDQRFFSIVPRLWRVLPCICNIVFLCVLDVYPLFLSPYSYLPIPISIHNLLGCKWLQNNPFSSSSKFTCSMFLKQIFFFCFLQKKNEWIWVQGRTKCKEKLYKILWTLRFFARRCQGSKRNESKNPQ